MTRRKKILVIASAFISLYVATYAPLSLLGGYEYGQTGKLRWHAEFGGFAASDIFQWQPRFARCRIFQQIDGATTLHANLLGYVYAPLILLDQHFVHRTKPIFDEQGNFIQYGKKG